MKRNDAIRLIDEKVVELKSTIAALKVNETLSKATRGTQLYARGRERRVLTLIRALVDQLDNVELTADEMDTFTLITTLASERTVNRFEAVEGQSVMELMQKYPKKSLDKLEAALLNLNLKIDPATMTVVKA